MADHTPSPAAPQGAAPSEASSSPATPSPAAPSQAVPSEAVRLEETPQGVLADTIFAPATAPGVGGVAIVRLSGPAAGDALVALTGKPVPEPRRAVRADLCDPQSSEPLDDAMAIWFPAPASFTGEDVAELHIHGGRAVMDGVLAALTACEGLRLAEAGEFTRRAFENGKMDLTAAEGIADLVAAETEAQRKQALRQTRGVLGELYEGWRDRLVRAQAYQEAEIDFSDEELPDGMAGAVRQTCVELAAEIAAHLDDGHRGERLRDGLHIAIIGPPNAGKSSLLNHLARRDAAIVSETAGTTRDVIDVHLNVGGYPVVMADTAGLRDSTDEIEAEGVRRARLRAGEADLRLAVFDGAAWPDTDSHTRDLLDADTLVIVNKADLADLADDMMIEGYSARAVSAITGDGLDALLSDLEARIAGRFGAGDAPALTRARHRAALEDCRDGLARFLDDGDAGDGGAGGPELAAEDLRLAARALGRITGRVGVEDMLDVIFRDFCIGK